MLRFRIFQKVRICTLRAVDPYLFILKLICIYCYEFCHIMKQVHIVILLQHRSYYPLYNFLYFSGLTVDTLDLSEFYLDKMGNTIVFYIFTIKSKNSSQSFAAYKLQGQQWKIQNFKWNCCSFLLFIVWHQSHCLLFVSSGVSNLYPFLR